MAIAQQYGVTKGYLPLLKQVEELVLRYHNPPNYANSRVIVNIGAQDGFSRTLEMVLSPGDYVIVEEPTFCGALCVMRPLNVNFLGIKIDDQGNDPRTLKRGSFQNGILKKLGTLCQESPRTLKPRSSISIYLSQEFPESFLSIDTDGRVMRMDSFAKIISSGFRIGYLTGPEPLVDKYIQHSEMTMMHPSCLSQVVISEILTKWSTEGFENHVKDVRKLYSDRKEALNKAVKKHLSVLEDTEEMIVKRAFKKELILMTGNPFMIDDKKPCPYLRLSYSFLPPEKFDEACRRTAELIREEVELCAKNKKN
ncbi:Kynurenine/alpha-aminoadipate aminotransferase, mitochondrial [Armadillidium vulgare]|nr:Kynurenine/alpha-aminoadipate aminotransferase, mitochondrial [Armadillidium vulgare]